MSKHPALTLMLFVACAPPKPPEHLASLQCAPTAVDTSSWNRKVVGQLFSVNLPADMRPDTSTLAELEFYHGGGRYRDGGLGFEYGFLSPDRAAYQIQRPAGWLPGSPACFPIRTPGWEARVLAYKDSDGETRVSAWFRRPEKPDHWLFVSAASGDSTRLPALFTMIASVAPDTGSLAQSR